LLEAVSLLSPGKGMRGAELNDLQNRAVAEPSWAVAANLDTPFGDIHIGTGKAPDKDRRLVRIQGETAKSQSALAEYFSCLWLTPQMDRLFLDAASARRKFLDRMIFAFDPSHAGRMTRYENALSQRSKLLKEGVGTDSWLSSLEEQMAETGVAIAAARVDFTERLHTACARREGHDFPVASLALAGFLETALQKRTALEAEENFRAVLKGSRDQDALTGGSGQGPHRSDLIVTYHEKNMPAAQCSTGEQKALLIGIVLSHAGLIRAECGDRAVLLLDEVAAHLDEGRRAALFGALAAIGGQVWVTGTDDSLFSAIPENASFFHVTPGEITRKNP
jgi:DNA replication and repair protein RecF